MCKLQKSILYIVNGITLTHVYLPINGASVVISKYIRDKEKYVP